VDCSKHKISALEHAKDNTIITYVYDNNGSLISKETTVADSVTESLEYEYNLQGRLAYVYDVKDNPDGVLLYEYLYNPDGIRIAKYDYSASTATRTYYLVDSYNHTGYAQVIEENTSDDDGQGGWIPTTRIQYTIGDDVISQTESTSSDGGVTWIAEDLDDNDIDDTEYLLYDGHGSTRQLCKGAYDPADPPVTIDSYSYDAYGVMLSNISGAEAASNADTSLLFAGEQYDGSADMYYNRARYYDPSNGRFNRTDPYAGNTQDPQSLHKYAYVHNNPVNNIDPTGMFSFFNVGIAVIAIMAVLYIGWSIYHGATTEGPSRAQRATMNRVIPRAVNLLDRAIDRMNDLSVNPMSEHMVGYERWFGQWRLNRVRQVKSYYRGARNALNNRDFDWDVSNNQGGAWAVTDQALKLITFYPIYWMEPEQYVNGRINQPCVLIHEMLHLTSPEIIYQPHDDADEAPDPEAFALELARIDPQEAVKSAWNLELYMQNEF
jgi:RHS repeat-associated protein